MSDKYTAEYLRRQSACVHIAIEGEPAKDISEGLRAGADYADRLAAYERNTIKRDESVPDFARSWEKEPRGHCWWIGDRNRRIADVLVEPSPDLRPDIEGLIALPIVDLDTP